jgi:hypothetical protein
MRIQGGKSRKKQLAVKECRHLKLADSLFTVAQKNLEHCAAPTSLPLALRLPSEGE